MVLSIDWLQLYCTGVINVVKGYEVKRLEYSTRIFKHIDEIYFNKKKICTATHTPFSSVLEQDMIIIKFENYLLYEKDLFLVVDNFLKDFNLTYKSISRLDIAADFNTFYKKRNVQNFLNDFLKNNVRKIGKANYKLQGCQKSTHVVDYLRFGGNASEVSAYIYNKTKELNEVKMKSYIVDMWRCSGLDVDTGVWRLEFSIKSAAIKMLDKQSGDLQDISLENIKDKCFREKMFLALYEKYFCFRTNTGKTNVTREKKIVLFENNFADIERYFVRGLGDATRADKIFIKKMEASNCELRDLKKYYKEQENDILFDFVVGKGLEDYYLQKIRGGITDRLISYKIAQNVLITDKMMSKNSISEVN